MFMQFLKDENGQTTTEYLLILAVIVVIISVLGKGMQDKLKNTIEVVFKGIDGRINELMQGASGN